MVWFRLFKVWQSKYIKKNGQGRKKNSNCFVTLELVNTFQSKSFVSNIKFWSSFDIHVVIENELVFEIRKLKKLK